MKIRQLRRLAAALVLSLGSFLTLGASPVHAAAIPLYWCNAAGGAFNTAANWNTNSDCTSGSAQVPTGGEDLVFLTTGLSADITINNDIPSLSVNTITFQGTGTHNVTLTGNALTVAGGTITDNAASGGTMEIDNNLTFGAATAVTAASNTVFVIGDFTSPGTLNAGTFALSLVGNGNLAINDVVSGSGAITTSGSNFVALNGANTFTGPVVVQAGELSIGDASALGTTAAGTTVDAGASLDFGMVNANTFTIAEPLDITPGPSGFSLQADSFCGGSGCTEASEYIFSGDITLNGNTKISIPASGFVARFTGNISGGTLSKFTGSNGTLAFGAATTGSSSGSSSGKTPKTPDTGFGLITANPLLAAFVSFAVTGSLVVMARRLKPIAK